MEQLLEMLAAEKRWQDLLEWAERWILRSTAPETAYRQMIAAYNALGDRARAASTYERCVKALRELDLEPSEETRSLVLRQRTPWHVPIPLTSFIGREKELIEITSLMEQSRLVTLTGTGGAGKTRLAIQAVAEILHRFPDGVWFLDLAPLNHGELVPGTLASLLGLRESAEISIDQKLVNYFRTRRALVIFDNCEHVIESCAELVTLLLTSCEELAILATSREALRVSGEIPYRVPSLEVPRLEAGSTIEQLMGSEAVKLFVERAAVPAPGLGKDPKLMYTVAQICQRLDGIPLAIELASARLQILTPEQILKRLDDRFNLLMGGLRSSMPRHRTLRATIEWSYELLSEKERILFGRLAVFSGGWTLDAAEYTCRGNEVEPGEILDLLDRLIDKSLVIPEASTVSDPTAPSLRYRSLETIRQFAGEKLAEKNDADQWRSRHLDYFVRKAEELEPFLTGTNQSGTMDYLEIELDNIRHALEWSISNRMGEKALRLFGALGWFWIVHCHFQDGIQWFSRAWELQDEVSKSVQAKAFGHAGSLMWLHRSIPEARTFLEKSIELYRELNDGKELSNRLLALGLAELSDGNLAEARTLFDETLAIGRAAGHGSAVTRALFNLADVSSREGDTVNAARFLEESLALARQLADDHLTSMVLLNFGVFAVDRKDFLKARECFEEALNISLDLKNNRVTALSLLGFADILCAYSSFSESANLQGYGIGVLKDLTVNIIESEMGNFRKTTGEITKSMGEEFYQKEFQFGSSLSLEEAVKIALKEPGRS
jgi:non-specific serine/threonine protein kinase